MRKLLVIMLVAGLVGGAAAAPATAKKKKKKAKPVATELFLHGNSQIGEVDLPSQWLDSMLNEMSPEAPEGTSSKSQFVTNYVIGPNTRCDGNGLLGTVWRGDLSGTVKGDATLTLHTAATPGALLQVGLYPDGAGTCAGGDDPEPEPAARVEVAVAPGQTETEVVFEDLNFTTVASLVLQVAPGPNGVRGHMPGLVRAYYDSETHPSSLAFNCTPASGKTC